MKLNRSNLFALPLTREEKNTKSKQSILLGFKETKRKKKNADVLRNIIL